MKTHRRLAALTLALGYAAVLAALIASTACTSSAPARPETPRSDAEITAAVKAQLATDTKINPFAVEVDTRSGMVTLSGRVPDPRSASAPNGWRAASLACGASSTCFPWATPEAFKIPPGDLEMKKPPLAPILALLAILVLPLAACQAKKRTRPPPPRRFKPPPIGSRRGLRRPARRWKRARPK